MKYLAMLGAVGQTRTALVTHDRCSAVQWIAGIARIEQRTAMMLAEIEEPHWL
jgi:hypothetical protein